MKVKTAELRHVSDLLFEHLERNGISELEVDKDFYWNVQDDQLFSVYEKPGELTMGQLSEDWQQLQAIASGRKPPIGYGFAWLSSILRFISTKVTS